jgi:N-acetylglucosamine kinase-like BadF-type ATPase
MSGVDRYPDKIKVASWVQEMFPQLKHNYTESETQSQNNNNTLLIENDAVAALASGTNGKLHGVVVISGTGMIVLGYAKDGVTHKRSGGWGYCLTYTTY